ncbi:MAG: Sec-independent protein translocase protein TatB [Acidiferrobacterales bacterium]|nr:Sec-independent protein translocase protein TatB [Acidiferrobacterales bacterium]
MFDIGFWELTIIGIVALVIVGPERLPGLARTAGLWVGKGRRMLADVKRDIDREIKSSEMADLNSLKKDFEEAGKEVEKVSDEIKTESGMDDLKSTFKDASPIKEDLKEELDEIDQVSKDFDSELSGKTEGQTVAKEIDAEDAVEATSESPGVKKIKQSEDDAA